MPSITIALSDDHHRVLRDLARSVSLDDGSRTAEQVAEVILLHSTEVQAPMAADRVTDRLIDDLGEHFYWSGRPTSRTAFRH